MWYFVHGHLLAEVPNTRRTDEMLMPDNTCFFPIEMQFDHPGRLLRHSPTLFGVSIGYDGVKIWGIVYFTRYNRCDTLAACKHHCGNTSQKSSVTGGQP